MWCELAELSRIKEQGGGQMTPSEEISVEHQRFHAVFAGCGQPVSCHSVRMKEQRPFSPHCSPTVMRENWPD